MNKKHGLILLASVAVLSGCGDDKVEEATHDAMDICALISRDEAQQLIGKTLADGEPSVSPAPGSKVCVWKNEKGVPELSLFYFPDNGLGLDSFALPDSEIEPITISGGEGVAVWTAKDAKFQDHQTLVEVVVKGEHGVFNLNVVYADTAKGSQKADQMVELAKRALDRSH